MNTSWLRHLATALALSTAFSACVIGDGDGDVDDDGFDDDGGESGDDGSVGGRTAGGGRAAGGGTAGRGGSGGTAGGGRAGSGGGGAGGTAEPTVQCEPGSGPTSTPAANCTFPPSDEPDPCLECLSANCCSELRNCYGVNPYNVCGYGGPTHQSEYLCVQACLVEREIDGPYDPEMDPGECGALCRTIPTGSTRACSLPGNYTATVVDCMVTECEDACIVDPAKQ
ncbi:MAG TPA: hypothetical protein VER33_14175 [Polyangiaceae bacterium]|nr:hypothetical protein [Polyangiaceae bacterium]